MRGSKTDPNSFVKVYESECIPLQHNPEFPKLKKKSQRLCNSQLDLPIQIQIINQVYEKIVKASVETTFEKLEHQKEFQLQNIADRTPYGTLRVRDFRVDERPLFLDYLRMGWQINMSVAIDFTASNGYCKSPNSLHFMSEGKENQYQMAIRNVGKILEAYDADKSFPVYGFGGVPHYMNTTEV